MRTLVRADKSVIVAADVSIKQYPDLLSAVAGVPGIGGVKIGFRIGLTGLDQAVAMTRKIAGDLAVIYDHQKAGTDIPDTGKVFAEIMGESGVDAAILFPHSGPATQEAWTRALQETGVTVIVGGEMTHPQYLESDGGYIHDGAPKKIYSLAANIGVRDFVVPGNKPDSVQYYREILEDILGKESFTLYAPGFITQGGDVSKTGEVAGKRWHAIVGSAIYKAGDIEAMRVAAENVTAQIQVEGGSP